jgi:hypothetical protein
VTALRGLELADAETVWERLGFAAADGRCVVGDVTMTLGAAGARGIAAWELEGERTGDLDGLPTRWCARAAPASAVPRHPNGVSALDHVVVASPDVERTCATLERAGMDVRRRDHARGRRHAFMRAGSVIVEVVGPLKAGGGSAAFWGLAFEVADLGVVAASLGARLGDVRDAVQPGRRIATVARAAGSSVRIAFLSAGVQ